MMLRTLSTSNIVPKVNISEVFSTTLYTGNATARNIINNIDLLDNDGIIIIRDRVSTNKPTTVFNTLSGALKVVYSNLTNAESTLANSLSSFNSDGFSIGSSTTINENTDLIASWTIREANKFFNIKSISHITGTASTIDLSSLGEVGMVTIKSTNNTSNWFSWHKNLTPTYNILFNATQEERTANAYLSVNDTTLIISSSAPTNNYIILSWANDESSDGVIKCNKFVTDASGASSFDFGWAEGIQYILIKCITVAGDWEVYDTARTTSFAGNDARIIYNSQVAEDSVARISVSGTSLVFAGLSASKTYIFMAIRGA